MNSLVHFRGRYWLYARANLESQNGGRFVQVTSSLSNDPNGPYAPFETIDIAGYTSLGSVRNLYFAAVMRNPIDAGRTLLGLFPVALTVQSRRRRASANLSGIIGLSFSCDAVHWAPLIVLQRTRFTASGDPSPRGPPPPRSGRASPAASGQRSESARRPGSAHIYQNFVKL